MKSLKLKIYSVENISYFCDTILVDAESLESSGPFNCVHRGCIFENNSYYISTRRLQNPSSEDLIAYESLVQEATDE